MKRHECAFLTGFGTATTSCLKRNTLFIYPDARVCFLKWFKYFTKECHDLDYLELNKTNENECLYQKQLYAQNQTAVKS